MWDFIFVAIGLMLVLEGILPFVAPEVWRNIFRQILELSDNQLRFSGLTSMIVGLVFIMISR